MKPEWRTPVVIALCQAMLDARKLGPSFGPLPLLADALTEAGCDDEQLLSDCRTLTDRIQQERLINVVFSKKTEDAVKWLEDFAFSWHFGWEYVVPEGEEYGEYEPRDGYGVLVEAAIEKPADEVGDDFRYVVAMGIDLHTASELGKDHDRFWKNLELVTGQRFEAAHRDGFSWSCSC